MIKGQTKSGFAFEVSESISNDFRVLEAIADADSEDESAKVRGAVELVRLILGDGKKALYKHLEEIHGGVPVDAVIGEVVEVLAACREQSKAVKN